MNWKGNGRRHRILITEAYPNIDNTKMDFDVLLTVHLSIILAIDQLNAQILIL